MIDIILISNQVLNLEKIKNFLQSKVCTIYQDTEQLTFTLDEFHKDIVILSKNPEIEGYYENDELNLIHHFVSNPKFYIIECEVKALLVLLRILIELNQKIIIDDDHGHILPVTTFYEFLQTQEFLPWKTITENLKKHNFSET